MFRDYMYKYGNEGSLRRSLRVRYSDPHRENLISGHLLEDEEPFAERTEDEPFDIEKAPSIPEVGTR